MRKITLIIVHCSATKPGHDIGAAEIRRWHTRDNGWDDIGYHYVIRRDGKVESGRPLERAGAHTYGNNADSIGICLAGGISATGKAESNYTPEQWTALARLVSELVGSFPGAGVFGHRDFARKDCPCFDAKAWWEGVKHECDI